MKNGETVSFDLVVYDNERQADYLFACCGSDVSIALDKLARPFISDYVKRNCGKNPKRIILHFGATETHPDGFLLLNAAEFLSKLYAEKNLDWLG